MFDPEVDRLIEESANFQRLPRAAVTDQAIEDRCLLAAINGAAEILETADDDLSPAVIDAIWVEHLGFPAWKGGPFHQARRMTVAKVVADLEALHAKRNTAGCPAAFLVRSMPESNSFI